jgi:hypothetical protein
MREQHYVDHGGDEWIDCADEIIWAEREIRRIFRYVHVHAWLVMKSVRKSRNSLTRLIIWFNVHGEVLLLVSVMFRACVCVCMYIYMLYNFVRKLKLWAKGRMYVGVRSFKLTLPWCM